MAVNLSSLSAEDFAELETELDRHGSLSDVLAWTASKPRTDLHPNIVAEVITQDEFTHDIVVPFKNVFLVYDTT